MGEDSGGGQRLLTIAEVCNLLGVAKSTLDVICREGGLRKIRLSHRVVRFDPRDVSDYLNRVKSKQSG